MYMQTTSIMEDIKCPLIKYNYVKIAFVSCVFNYGKCTTFKK